MRTYETIFIVHPDVSGDAYQAVLEKFRKVLTDQEAAVLKVDEWGTRKLAYPIRKQSRGTYVLVVFEANPEVVAEFERRLRIDDAIMRFQTVYLEKGFQTAPEPVEAAPAPAETGAGVEAEETEIA